MSLPLYVGITSSSGVSTSAIFDMPASPTENNLLVCVFHSPTNTATGSLFSLAGWNKVGEVGNNPPPVNISECATAVWWKYASASEPATYTINISGADSNSYAVNVLEYSNAHQVKPIIDFNPTDDGGGGHTPVVWGGVDHYIDNCVVLACGTFQEGGDLPVTPPGGWTERRESGSQYIIEQSFAAAGSTGDISLTPAATAESTAIVLAIANGDEGQILPALTEIAVAVNSVVITGTTPVPILEGRTQTDCAVSSNSHVFDMPASPTPGNMLLLIGTSGDDADTTPGTIFSLSGWNKLGEAGNQQANKSENCITAFWKIAGESEPATETLTSTGFLAGDRMMISVYEFSNADPTTKPPTAVFHDDGGGGHNPQSHPGVTTLYDNALCIAAAASNGIGSGTFTVNSPWTDETYELHGTLATHYHVNARHVQQTLGATGTFEHTRGSNGESSSVVIAIYPPEGDLAIEVEHIPVAVSVLTPSIEQSVDGEDGIFTVQTYPVTITGTNFANTVEIGRVVENNVARSLTAVTPLVVELGRAEEANTARVLGAVTAVSQVIGKATETSQARNLEALTDQTIVLGRATESNIARTLSGSTGTTVLVGRATESNTARGLTAVSAQTVEIGRATESNTARELASVTAVVGIIGKAMETNTARTFIDGSVRVVVVSQAIENNQARVLTAFAGVQLHELLPRRGVDLPTENFVDLG